MSRSRARISASRTSNSCCDNSPSSTRICASSSCSRSFVSSLNSVSTAAAILSNTNRRPPTSSESRMNIVNRQSAIDNQHWLVGSFQLEADVDEVIGRPGTRKLERQPLVTLPDILDPCVERLLETARDEERRIHDHPIANRLVRSRRHRHVSQRFEDLGHVAFRLRLKRGVNQPAVLHPREV